MYNGILSEVVREFEEPDTTRKKALDSDPEEQKDHRPGLVAEYDESPEQPQLPAAANPGNLPDPLLHRQQPLPFQRLQHQPTHLPKSPLRTLQAQPTGAEAPELAGLLPEDECHSLRTLQGRDRLGGVHRDLREKRVPALQPRETADGEQVEFLQSGPGLHEFDAVQEEQQQLPQLVPDLHQVSRHRTELLQFHPLLQQALPLGNPH